MDKPFIPENELLRLESLRALKILDTPIEERFDRITRLVASYFNVPYALISLIDDKRQWFKSHYGLDVSETCREISFCGHAIYQEASLVVPNALDDSRFSDNPLVTGAPNIRFYAGVPLKSAQGYMLGTLCIIDDKPWEVGAFSIERLNDFAIWAQDEINKTIVIKEASAALEDNSEQNFKETFEQAAVGMAHVSLDGKWLKVNRKLCEITGYSESELMSMSIEEITHPDDLKISQEFFNRALNDVIENYSLEKRYIHKSGAVIWIKVTVALGKKPDGEHSHFIRIIEDIQERKMAELALLHAKEDLEIKVEERTSELRTKQALLDAITETIPESIAYVDYDLRYRYCNQNYSQMIGKDRLVILGRTIEQVISPSLYAVMRPHLEKVLQGVEVKFEHTLKHSGAETYMECHFIPNKGIDQQVVGFYILVWDVTQAKLRESQFIHKASIDAMTGLLNKQAITDLLHDTFATNKRNNHPYALVFLDIDYFKRINDSLGHAVGDEVIQLFAKRITETVRATDYVGRMGGDEFLIILPQIYGLKIAEKISDKLLTTLCQPVTIATNHIPLSTSIGVGYWENTDVSSKELLKLADMALYDAKAAGRGNCKIRMH